MTQSEIGKSGQGGGTRVARRYDVDWLRTIALGLLILFHIVLTFQSWAESIGFPQNDELLEELVPVLSMLSVWRIPLLFVISGMGVRFALEHRSWRELLKDRTIRIAVPFVFNLYIFGSILAEIARLLGWDADYTISFGHLWFLANIFAYVLWLIYVLIYLKEHPNCALLRFVSEMLRKPFGLFVFAVPLMIEAQLVNPEHFSVYVDTVHGWLIGLICFFWGFLFISVQDEFWPAVRQTRWSALAVAVALFSIRLVVFELQVGHNWLIALESMSWILAVVGFGSLYLNKPSRGLEYLSQAVYPVYIVHMPVQFAIAYVLLPLTIGAYAKLAILLLGTFGMSFLLYEGIRRLKWIRPLFGMKLKAT